VETLTACNLTAAGRMTASENLALLNRGSPRERASTKLINNSRKILSSQASFSVLLPVLQFSPLAKLLFLRPLAQGALISEILEHDRSIVYHATSNDITEALRS
jgi:hypothetical protein